MQQRVHYKEQRTGAKPEFSQNTVHFIVQMMPEVNTGKRMRVKFSLDLVMSFEVLDTPSNRLFAGTFDDKDG
jgi:hypothetical protein